MKIETHIATRRTDQGDAGFATYEVLGATYHVNGRRVPKWVAKLVWRLWRLG